MSANRKFSMAISALLLNVALLLGNFIGSGEFTSLEMAIIGAYFTANVVQKKA